MGNSLGFPFYFYGWWLIWACTYTSSIVTALFFFATSEWVFSYTIIINYRFTQMYSWHDPKKDLRKGNHFQTGYSSCFLCFFQLVSFAYSNTNTIGRRLTPFGLIYSIFFFALYPINNNYNFFLISPLFFTHFAASGFFPSSSLIYAVFFSFSQLSEHFLRIKSAAHTHTLAHFHCWPVLGLCF